MKNTRKPKQLRSKSTVNAVIDAGFVAVMRDGLEGATVIKVCDIAGVGSGTFYEYFKNKDDLYVNMHQRFINEISELIIRIIPEILDLAIPDAIRLIFIRLGELLAENNHKYSSWLSVCSKLNTDENQVAAVKAVNILAIEYAVKHPEVLRIKNLRLMVHILITSGLALTMNYFSNKNSNFSFDELVECLVNLTLSYIDDERNQIKGI